MNAGTLSIVRSTLEADPTVDQDERKAILATLRNGVDTAKTETFLSPSEFAKKYAVHPQSPLRWIREGTVEAIRIGGVVRIKDEGFAFVPKPNRKFQRNAAGKFADTNGNCKQPKKRRK